MGHYPEHSIDLFTLNPNLLDQSLREGIRAHLETCAGCRSLSEFLRSFYEELDSSTDELSPEAEAMIQRLMFRRPSFE